MPTTYKPGEKVPKSGIYLVLHDQNHEQQHEVTCIMGKIFPPCSGRGKGVRFQLARAAHHIENHELFN